MTKRARIGSLAAGLAVAAALLWAMTQPRAPRQPAGRNTPPASLFVPAHIPSVAPPAPRHQPNTVVAQRSRPTRSSSPSAVAYVFVTRWLGCTYHHGLCRALPGALPAYAAAVSRQHGASRITPAEQTARPTIIALHITRSCADSAIATATYQDGQGGHFQLHLNLVHEPEGWRIFDVAEAPPHIPLPTPLSHGPRGC